MGDLDVNMFVLALEDSEAGSEDPVNDRDKSSPSLAEVEWGEVHLDEPQDTMEEEYVEVAQGKGQRSGRLLFLLQIDRDLQIDGITFLNTEDLRRER